MPGRLRAGVSGFSYPTWRGGFYPPSARPADFLRLYAERLPALELNATGRRLPTEAQLERWAAQTPPSFRFAVKLTGWVVARPEAGPGFCRAVRALGERLGPILVQLPPLGRHDDALLARLVERLDPGLAYAFERKDDAWQPDAVRAAAAGLDAVVVNELDERARFRYLRLREPPYDDAALDLLAGRIRPLLADGVDVHAYFRHEDEPTGPAYALGLLARLGQAASP
ncbi:MAG: DUF72 domain-containing protein [Thermoleophilia bacterium]